MPTTNHGNHPTPCPRQVAPKRRSQVISRATILRVHNLPSDYVALRAKSGQSDVGASRKNLLYLSTCPTNVPSVPKSSKPSMIGSVMRNHSIYRLRDGFAHFKGLALPRSRLESNAVSSAARCNRMTTMLKRTTTRHVRKEASKNAPFTGKITSFSICVWYMASSLRNGRWRAGCCLYLMSGRDAGSAVRL
jgi:hypothetical protein